MMKLLAVVVFVVSGFPFLVQARSNLHNWFEAQHDCAGTFCCSEADGSRYDGDYSFGPKGSVIIGKEKIDACRVLKGPNPTGSAIIWRDGTGDIRCFALGPGS